MICREDRHIPDKDSVFRENSNTRLFFELHIGQYREMIAEFFTDTRILINDKTGIGKNIIDAEGGGYAAEGTANTGPLSVKAFFIPLPIVW